MSIQTYEQNTGTSHSTYTNPGKDALDVLAEIAKDKNQPTEFRIRAAEAILEYQKL